MGPTLSTLWGRLLGKNQEFRILMLGLDAAGKTTLLYKMKLDECKLVKRAIDLFLAPTMMSHLLTKIFVCTI